MSPKKRFQVWVIAVAGALLAAPMIGYAPWIGRLVSVFAISLMLWLLRTTPVAAIKLNRLMSLIVLVAGAAWVAWFSGGGPIPAVIGAAAAAVLMTVMPRSISPWWGIAALWTPWAVVWPSIWGALALITACLTAFGFATRKRCPGLVFWVILALYLLPLTAFIWNGK